MEKCLYAEVVVDKDAESNWVYMQRQSSLTSKEKVSLFPCQQSPDKIGK